MSSNSEVIFRDDVPSMSSNSLRVNRCMPSCNLKFCLKDEAWFIDKYRKAFFFDEQEVYHHRSRNHSCLAWNDFVRLRDAAQTVYASAERLDLTSSFPTAITLIRSE